MSIEKSLGAGMADVFGNALLAQSIHQQQATLDEANANIAAWAKHSKNQQAKILELQAFVKEQGAIIDDLRAKKTKLEQQTNELQKNLNTANEKIARIDQINERTADQFMDQVRYMRELKIRLIATEKALRHSSSKSVGLERLQEFLIHETSCMEQKIQIGPEGQAVMDTAYKEFMESGQLTPDADTQRVLDELKLKAPDRKPGLMN